MRNKYVWALAIILVSVSSVAQNVAINADGSTPDAKAILDIKSTTKGILIPRMTTAERNAITGSVRGLLVYDITTSSFWYHSGSAWKNMNAGWALTGNGSTDPASSFLGTTDFVPLTIKVNNQFSGIVSPNTIGNTFWGYQSGMSNTSVSNTAFGYRAFASNIEGSQSVAIGKDALYSNMTGNDNTALGTAALYANTTGSTNTALGSVTLISNTTGGSNTATGYFSLGRNTSGSGNTATGAFSLSNNTTGHNNTSAGYQSLYHNISGIENTAIGYNALLNNDYGALNTALGYESLKFNTIGSWNTGIGYKSLRSNTEGNQNTAVGNSSMYNNTTGYFNAAFGVASLQNNTDGFNNTAVGVAADVATGSLNNATAIGFATIVDASDKVRIGNSAVTVIEGQVGFTTPSDGRFKFNVQEDIKGLDFITRLRPVSYQFDVRRFDEQVAGYPDSLHNALVKTSYEKANQLRRSGFIAQEVEKAAQAAGYNFNGLVKPSSEKGYYTLHYDGFVMPLVKAVQEQQQEIKKLEKTIATQHKKLDSLQQQVNELRKLVQSLQPTINK